MALEPTNTPAPGLQDSSSDDDVDIRGLLEALESEGTEEEVEEAPAKTPKRRPAADDRRPDVEEDAEDTPDRVEDDVDPETEEEPEAEATEEPEQLITVKVAGEELKVTLDELKRGYSREQDYTRKNQARAERERQLEAQASEVGQALEKYSKLLPLLEQQVNDPLASFAKIDWTTLASEDPQEFSRLRGLYDVQKEKVERVREERAKVEAELAERQRKLAEKYVQEQHDLLLQKLPAWKDEKVRTEQLGHIMKWAEDTLGVSRQELTQVTDHRLILALNKAAAYDKLLAARKGAEQKREKTPAPAAPGVKAPARPPVTDITRAKQRLAKTGRAEDAALGIGLLLEMEEKLGRK